MCILTTQYMYMYKYIYKNDCCPYNCLLPRTIHFISYNNPETFLPEMPTISLDTCTPLGTIVATI